MPRSSRASGEAAAGGDDLYMCPVVFYELWRGLAYRDARRQLEDLDAFARTLQWVDYERPMWVDAARMWADGRRRGRPHDDADLRIRFVKKAHLSRTPTTGVLEARA